MINITLGSLSQFIMEVRCERPDWQLSSMTQIFSQQLPLLSQIEQLEIRKGFWSEKEMWRDDPDLDSSLWKDDPDMDSSLWLELFHLCRVCMYELLGPTVATALQELGEGRTMEVLPALRNLSFEGLQPAGPVQKAIQSFVASRQLSGYPIDIQNWEPQWPPDYF